MAAADMVLVVTLDGTELEGTVQEGTVQAATMAPPTTWTTTGLVGTTTILEVGADTPLLCPPRHTSIPSMSTSTTIR